MPLTIRAVFALLAASVAVSGCATATARSSVPVEVWRGGDDGLTVRFADALEAALTQSPAFTPSTSGQPAMLVAEIPTNLEWTRAGGDIQVHFVVNFRRADSRLLRTSSGTCWEARLDICVGHALSDAQRALGSR
jgi:hypothetical protein